VAFEQHNTVSHSLLNLKLFVSLPVNRGFWIIQYQISQILLYQLFSAVKQDLASNVFKDDCKAETVVM
jgi:hypothetical protein